MRQEADQATGSMPLAFFCFKTHSQYARSPKETAFMRFEQATAVRCKTLTWAITTVKEAKQ
jgi:hypothetical protein